MKSTRTVVTALLAAAMIAPVAVGQTGLTGAYQDGQVFLRWELAAGPVLTYDLYASTGPETDISGMTLLSRIFPEEATGERLHNLQPAATLRVPSGGGSTTLTATQGAIGWTPHEAGERFFAVVVNGQTAVTADNRVRVAFNYDPVNEPVRPHFQFFGATEGGYPYAAYMVWVDGAEDPEAGRPDFPVMASATRGCVPHVFTVTSPLGGLPAGPYPAVFCLHGGEGAYQNFMPGDANRAAMSIEMTDGIVVTPDDNLYWQAVGSRRGDVTGWFGYLRHFDPFFVGARPEPSLDDVVTNYTSRRVFWFADWLTSGAGPFNVDPHRVAVIGHSAGSRGASVLSRQQPERFSAAVLQCALFSYRDSGPFFGDWSLPYRTNMVSPETGQPLTHVEVHTQSQRLSPLPYIPYTRLYSGKRDENPAGEWNLNARNGLEACNTSRLGIIVSWDEREHGVDKWAFESPDAFDDAVHCDPWPDVGQWVFPVKTERHGAQYLADRFRDDQSYPGFFDCDEGLNEAGRQPDPGPGEACSPEGVAWGSWGGCLDWTPATVVDTATRWECTVFLRGLSAVSVDNALVPVIRAGLAPRRTQAFRPAAGSAVYWIARTPAGGGIAQYGQATADAEGVVKVEGLLIPREDVARTRLVLSTSPLCQADFNADGFVDFFDYDDFVNCFETGSCPPERDADVNGDGFVDFFDYDDFVAAFERGC